MSGAEVVDTGNYPNPPKGYILFSKTPTAEPIIKKRYLLYAIYAFVCLVLVSWFYWTIGIHLANPRTSVILPFILFGPFAFYWLKSGDIIRTGLAVNLNHPFMDVEPAGKAEVLVRMEAENQWRKVGGDRVRLVDNDLLGGYDLIYDDGDFTPIGHFSEDRKSVYVKQINIINQAIMLASAINEPFVKDDDVARRKREEQDSGLLERECMEQEEVELESPFMKILKGQ